MRWGVREPCVWPLRFRVIVCWPLLQSFFSGTIVLSNNSPKQDQGIASSLVNTTVNYSIPLASGLAHTIVKNVDLSGQDPLAGYRGAWYRGIGLDGVAVLIALCFVWRYE